MIGSCEAGIEGLVGILEQELDLCEKMVGVLAEERDAVSGLKPEELESVLLRKGGIVASMKTLDTLREEQTRSLGLPADSLAELINSVEAPQKGRLSSILDRFNSAKERIADISAVNAKLIDRSLHYVRAAQGFLSGYDVEPTRRVSLEA